MQVLSNNTLMQIIYQNNNVSDTFQLKSGEKGTPQTEFRYFRFCIKGRRIKIDPYGQDNCIQFSKLKFFSDSGVVFQYSSDDSNEQIMINEVEGVESWGIQGGGGTESPVHGLMDTGNKCCIKDTNVPRYDETESNFTITYTLNKNGLTQNPLLDLSIYKNWCFYTANDESGRDPMNFSIEVKTDTTDWKTVDSFRSTRESDITTQRCSLAYTGRINIDNLY